MWTAPADAGPLRRPCAPPLRNLGLGGGRVPAAGLRHRPTLADSRRGRRRDGRPATGGPQPRHRHAHPRQAHRRPLPPGDPRTRRGPVPPGRPRPGQRPAVLRAHGHQPVPPAQPAAPNSPSWKAWRSTSSTARAGEGNEVGGDFYDLFPIRDGAYGFAIGDVCGTGPKRGRGHAASPGTPCACWPARASAARRSCSASTPPSSTRAPAAASSRCCTARCGPRRTAARA